MSNGNCFRGGVARIALTIAAVMALAIAAFSSPGASGLTQPGVAKQLAAPANEQAPQGFRMKPLADGKVLLSWGLPGLFTAAGESDAMSGRMQLPAETEPVDAEDVSLPGSTVPSGYPVTLGTRTLLGYRVLKTGAPVSDVLTKRYFVAQGPGAYSVEAVYEGLTPEPTNPQEFVEPTPGIFCHCTVDAVDISDYPRVTIRFSSDIQGVPFSAFTVREEGHSVQLIEDCFSNAQNGLVDVALVIDRSCGMNSYICDLASALECVSNDLPSCIDLKFAIVTYGKNGNGNSTCGSVYTGSPKHENASSLRTLQDAIDRLWEISGYDLTGYKEPAYDAIDCAANATPWRNGSQRAMLLISDENNDHCSQDGIPAHDVGGLTASLNNHDVKFYSWCRYNVVCDCYDFCTSNRPSCSSWSYSGCNSGYADFNPLAEATGGRVSNICNSIWELLDQIDLWTHCNNYTLCYDAGCCEPGQTRDIEVCYSWGSYNCCAWGSYCPQNCPPATEPWVRCWTGNPTGFTPGAAVTVCVEAGDPDGDLVGVRAHYSFGGCNETVAAEHVGGDRWCVTIPGNCTNASGDLVVHFNAEDACGAVASTECTVPNQTCLPPDIACWSGNPDYYTPGHDVVVCAVVRCAHDDDCGDDDDGDENGDGDDDDEDDDDCDGGSGDDGDWQDDDGDWHDEDCDGDHENDHCDGDNDGDHDWQDSNWNWHDNKCDRRHDGNHCDGHDGDEGEWQDGEGHWHDGDCDGDHDDHDGQDCPELTSVIATYVLNGCTYTGEATRSDGNRYCVTVPASCTYDCSELVVHFTAVNECGEQDEVACTVGCDTCVIHVGDYRTQTQGGWGQNSCNGNNVRCFLNNWFPTCFPGGITVGGAFTATFTSASAIGTYLPRGTTPGVLTQNYTNPTSLTSAGVFLSQVLALGLNIGFSDCNQSGFGADLGPLEVISGPFSGWTVDAIYALANTVLGGNLAALPGGTTLSDLNGIVDAINNNFDNGNCDREVLRKICEPQQCPPPDVTCWGENPVRFLRGSAQTICAMVTVPPGRPYAMTGRFQTFACTQAVAPVQVGADRWCITIPGNCTWDDQPISATFIVTDQCGQDSVTCSVVPCIGLEVVGDPNNPPTYEWGQNLTVCALVTDPDHDIDPNSLIGHYWIDGCDNTLHGTLEGNRYCITIPGSCLQSCADLYVNFMGDDICGNWGQDTIIVHSNNRPPVATCFTGNPPNFVRGQPLTMCVTVTDPDHNVTGVTGSYNTGAGCSATVPANYAEGRWCITIPATCTQICANISVNFVATDACGRTSAVTCTSNGSSAPPVVNCWTGAPATYLWGQPLQVCATTTDPDNDVTGVTASYHTGAGCNSTLNATFAEGRWCATIPANCTQVCGPIVVLFTATDACGRTDTSRCAYTMTPRPPLATCFPGNPVQFVPGQPLTLCAVIADPDNNIVSVTGSYNTGPGCVVVNQPATQVEGRWCITIPAACTQTCSNISVNFTATDACGLTGSVTCAAARSSTPPTVTCYTGGGTSYLWGQPLTACVTVTDPQNDVTGVTASYSTGPGCAIINQPLTLIEGRWCLTIPGNCTQVCGPIVVNFTATDACGLTGSAACTWTMTPRPPVVNCFTGNPQTYTYGQAVTVCAVVSDPDNNVVGVTGQYMIGACNTTIPATYAEGRWCVTVPANCMQSCEQLRVRFVAADGCGLTDVDTCRVNSSGTPPVVNCYTGNPTTYYWGQPITACVTVVDPDNDVTGVTASYHTGPSCNQTLAATFNGTAWCITIPGNCTQVCGPIVVNFTATDACGRTGTRSCSYTNIPRLPVVDCAPGNPPQYQYGQPLPMCAVVTDPDNNVVGVTARFLSASCDVTYPAVLSGGQWCATLPGNCTAGCSDIYTIFTATDACGGVEDDTCRVTGSCRPPTVLCWGENQSWFYYGVPLQVCALVGDPDGDLASVTATYNGVNCNTTVPANPVEPGRYCVTIPGSCTMVYGQMYVIFTATDQSGRTDRDTCYFHNTPRPPTVECWSGNPNEYFYGVPLDMCALAADPDNDIVSVVAHVVGGSCDQFFNAAPVGGGRYCLSIPATCTQSYTPIDVAFTVTDGAGLTQTMHCPLNAGSNPCQPATVVCWGQNPTQFIWGQPLTLCAVVNDPENAINDMTAHYIAGACDVTVAATPAGGGRFCVTIPGNCTQTLNPISVVFSVSDPCPPVVISATCGATIRCTQPSVVCWDANPTEFQFGASLTMCATVFDADADIVSVTARYVTSQCDQTVDAVPDGNGNLCVTVPGTCLENYDPLTVTFTATDRCGLHAEVTCTATPPPPLDECCYFCITEAPIVYQSVPINADLRNDEQLHQVAQIEANRLWLYWNEVPQADFYQVYCTNDAEDPANWTTAGFITDLTYTAWRHPLTVPNLPSQCFFSVAAMQVQTVTSRTGGCDMARWEFNVCANDIVPDGTDQGHDAIGYYLCPPDCHVENDPGCGDQATGFSHFDGTVPDNCQEHYEVENDSIFYLDRFQVWARIRLASEPTIATGPYYIISNASLDVVGGGWALRIDPGYFIRNGQRVYHNRLTGLVWNAELDGWMTLMSPNPTPIDSASAVPVGEWACVCMVIDGNQSMLLVNGQVVAAGDMTLFSHNNGVPLIIGSGYRHNTHPIEYPFRGDMDCIRLTDLDCVVP